MAGGRRGGRGIIIRGVMESILSVLNLMTTALAVLGGGMAGIFFVVAGIQFMTAQGDPQGMAKAKSAFFGSVVGVIIMGSAFLIPRALSEAVLQPAGVPSIASGYSEYDCDRILKQQLEIQRFANNEYKVNHLISLVQARSRFCGKDVWNPKAGQYRNANEGFCMVGRDHSGGWTASGMYLGGLSVPNGLKMRYGSGKWQLKKGPVVRDSVNNLMVIFNKDQPPGDGAICWVYFARYDVWHTTTPAS